MATEPTIPITPIASDGASPANGRKPWVAPGLIHSQVSDTAKFSNTLESPATAFGGGGILTNQGPS